MNLSCPSSIYPWRGGNDVTTGIVSVPRAHATVDGRDAEFEALFTELFPRLARFAYRLVRSEEAARDIAQESLARTWTRWIAVKDPEPYAFLVATNLVRERWRREPVESRVLTVLANSIPEVAGGPDLDLRDVVDRLPARLREVVLLHYFADLPLERVAQTVGRPVGTVKQRLHKARGLLAAMIVEGER
jgi:RNA polymerase sigma-70 factor (ECF subfamily)